MAKQLKVVMIEAFGGKRYLIRLDKDWKVVFISLFDRLMGNKKMGSVANISLRYIEEDKYYEILPAGELGVETERKEDDQENQKDSS